MSSLKKHVWDGPDPVSRVFCESSFQACLFADEGGPEVRVFRPEKTNIEGDRVLGDKAYVGSDVITPARKNMHDQGIWCLWMSCLSALW